MASLVNIYSVIFILTGVTVPCADAHYQRYVSLIYNVQKHHATTSVCFIMSRHKHHHSREFTLAYLLSRELSREGIPSQILNKREIGKRVTIRFNERGPTRFRNRPLTVVLLTNLEDMNDLAKNTRGTNMSRQIWLLIFDDELGSPICEYCKKPVGNIFHLLFNTEMLVMCCEDKMLKEWWSVRKNETETIVFGRLTITNDLELPENRSLYARRNQLHGIGLRVAIVTTSAFQIVEGDKFGQFFGAVVRALKRAMNFEITTTIRDDGFGSWNPENKSWTGVIGQISREEADLGIAEFSITNHRLDAVDFTLPLMMSRTKLYFKELDGSGVQWSAHFKAFDYPIWLMIILLVVTATILVTQIKMRSGVHTYLNLFFEQYLYVWGIFCQQGLSVFPFETSLRIAYFSTFVSAIVVSAAYSASLISFITVSTAALPFSSIEQFAIDGSYKLIVLQDSADWDFFQSSSSDPVVSKMQTMLKPTIFLPQSVPAGFEQVCSGKIAFFVSQVLVTKASLDLPCKVVHIDTGSMDSLAMILPAESQYTGVFNYHIQRFQDNGMMNRLKQKYLMKPPEPETTYNEVSLWGIAPILSVLAGGMVFALFILLCEIIYEKRWKFVKNLGKINSRGMKTRRIKIHGFFVNPEKQRNSHFSSRFRWRTGNYDYSHGQYLP